MGTPAFDTHAIVCPHCAQPSRLIPDEPLNGLYTCPNCKTRLVICWSGHFVRDPIANPYKFTVNLRRKSQPLMHGIRELGIVPIIGLVSAIALGGFALANGFGQLPERPDSLRPNPAPSIELESPLEPIGKLAQHGMT